MKYIPGLGDLAGCLGFMVMTASMTNSMRATAFSFFAYWSGWIYAKRRGI